MAVVHATKNVTTRLRSVRLTKGDKFETVLFISIVNNYVGFKQNIL